MKRDNKLKAHDDAHNRCSNSPIYSKGLEFRWDCNCNQCDAGRAICLLQRSASAHCHNHCNLHRLSSPATLQLCGCMLTSHLISSVEHLVWGVANNAATAFCCCVGNAWLLVSVLMCSLRWRFINDFAIVFLCVVLVW